MDFSLFKNSKILTYVRTYISVQPLFINLNLLGV